MKSSIATRWGIIDYKTHYPWWRPPAKVRILLYADGPVHFQGGSFLGLTYVKTLLESRAYFYVDFDVATAHRDGTDPSASIPGAKKLTDLDILHHYDEIWFFGFTSEPNLSPAEVTLLDQFMATPKYGGVLVTGDHAELGKGIAGEISRAGQMRLYPAPGALPRTWNTTLEEGPDPGSTFDFNDQSDDTPQTIRFKRYGGFFNRRPHPILCGPKGPINVFPDHQHEGEAIAPIPTAGDAHWPTKAGYQERPEVIAWGKIKDPAATKHGKEIGLVSVYDGHNVDVGRIVADSTWHHWFDINLTGIAPPPSPYAGFDDTPAGQAALTKIDAYFLNCGVWLAPPDKLRDMRLAGWWSILWSDVAAQLSPHASILWLGEQAIDVLGRYAPRCTVNDWIFEPIFKPRIPKWQWPMLGEKLELIDLPFEKFIAGGILRQLATELGPLNPKNSFPKAAPKDEILERAIDKGAAEGLSALSAQIKQEVGLVLKLVESDFRLPVEICEPTHSK